ncbi:hypothetical protein [Mycolicibacterium houstonense]|uniref:hypothetical protein n=1 Tax=Mycolicibacterium houstonense TaxID=146021 RepID=UPI00083619A9|nr:hypothetical protein [Mycolicibacterium houstonense]
MANNRTEVETDWFDEPSPAGSKRQGYITYQETESYLVDHIRGYVKQQIGARRYGPPYLHGYPTLTIHQCWDGYSEYTITDQWHEVSVDWEGHSFFFESTAAFFRALADVEPIEG